MSKKLICITIFGGILFSNQNLSSKHLMPSLDRLKSKVENALNGPKTSFKEFLEKTQNIGSKIFINGRDVEALNAEAEKKSFENEIKEIDAIFNNLYWCKQEVFAKQLIESQKTQNGDSSNILNLLKEKFKEKYPNVKSPLMTFAKDLMQESEALTTTKNKLEKAMSQVKKFKDLEKKYIAFAQNVVTYSETLNNIIKASDSL